MVNLFPLQFNPGIVRNQTRYSNKGGWYDCNWIRFRDGLPEMMGGWAKQITSSFLGICRSLSHWSVLTGTEYVGLGTNIKFYVSEDAEVYTDVTPIRRSVTLGADPLASTNLSAILRVTDVGHGATEGSYVTLSGATGFAGIPAGDINTEFSIDYDDVDHYFITVATPANATTTGGGAAVVADYQINIGYASNFLAFGWGTGRWGRSTWGSNDPSGVTVSMRLWSQETFGEDLIANIRNGGIYYWDATAPTARMVALEDLAGASDAPTIATLINVSAEERHALAFGANPIGSSVQDPLFVRWSDAEDVANWTPDVTNSAGGYRLSLGTRIVGVAHSRGEILIFTDIAMYSMKWTGPDFTFSFTPVGINTGTIAPNGIVATNDFVVWMGREQFFVYDGRIKALECPITDYIFRRLNYMQAEKVYGYTNSYYNEIGWVYPAGEECDSYVIYNYKEKAWYYGSITRTAWLDRGPTELPLATGDDSIMYAHEFGFNDGSTNPAGAINAYIESSPIETSDGGMGGMFMFINRFIPDITFRNSVAAAPAVGITLTMQNYPGAATGQTNTRGVVQSVTLPVAQFTDQCFVRLRGRSVTYRCESNSVDVTWRLGVSRLDFRTDGRR